MFHFISMMVNAVNVRRETLEGEVYLIAPMVMLKEGVFPTSLNQDPDGDTYYTGELLANSVPDWEGKPMTVYHPMLNNRYVSASEPELQGKRTIGFLKDVKYATTDLTANGWFNEKKTKEVDSRVHDALTLGKTMELSTGMFGLCDKTEGLFNGKKYKRKPKMIIPDHLAILPDKKGSCDISCGCGMLRNEADVQPMLANEASFGRIESELRSKLQGMVDFYPYIRDVYSKFFIYANGINRKLYKRAYKVGVDGSVTISEGEPAEVSWVQEYRSPEGEFIGNCSNKEQEMALTKTEKITLLVNAKVGWDATNKAALEGMPDAQFDAIYNGYAPVINKTAPGGGIIEQKPVVPPNPVVPPTNDLAGLQQLLANNAPALIPVLTGLMNDANAAKIGLVAQIRANPKNVFTEEWLMNQHPDVLRGFAAGMAGEEQTQPGHQSIPILVNQQTTQQQTGQPKLLLPPPMFDTKNKQTQ